MNTPWIPSPLRVALLGALLLSLACSPAPPVTGLPAQCINGASELALAFICVRDQSELKTPEANSSLSSIARTHASYLQGLGPQNIGDAHRESAAEAGFTGFTPEGRLEAAGWALENGERVRELVAWSSSESELDPLMQWVDSVYHRAPLLDSGLSKWGYGAAGGFGVLLVISRTPQNDQTSPFPLPHQINVPTHFNSDEEVPDPSEDRSWVGYPVSLTFPGGQEYEVLEAELLAKGQALDTRVLDGAHGLVDTVMMLASEGLPSEATIEAHVRIRTGGREYQRDWSFLTQD